MRALLFLFMIPIFIFGNDLDWSKQELKLLENKLQNLSKELPSLSQSELREADCTLGSYHPIVLELKISKNISRKVPILEYFQNIDPLAATYHETNFSIPERQKMLRKDFAKIMVFNIMTEKLLTLYRNNQSLIAYKKLYQESEKQMLVWAKEAANPKTSNAERQYLNLFYQAMLYELMQIPFPNPYNAYRLKRIYQIDSLTAAQEELLRLQNQR